MSYTTNKVSPKVLYTGQPYLEPMCKVWLIEYVDILSGPEQIYPIIYKTTVIVAFPWLVTIRRLDSFWDWQFIIEIGLIIWTSPVHHHTKNVGTDSVL